MAARKIFPASLGADVAAPWIEAKCCHGPGDVYGERVRLTGEEVEFLELCYQLDPYTGRKEISEALYSHRKGARKSELAAWIAHFEAVGPCRARLDDRGRPVAARVTSPEILCVATTEDQAELVYGAFREIANASDELAPLYDVGLQETRLIGRPGKVSLEQSRNYDALDGAKPTLEVPDELHRWTGKLRESYKVLRRNLRKRPSSQPWILAPSTAYAPGEQSMAETLHEHGTRERIVVQHRQAALRTEEELEDRQVREAAIVEAIGDAHWCGVEEAHEEYAAPDSDFEEWCRFFLNQPTASGGRPFTPAAWRALAVDDRLRPGDAVALGFDGGRYRDATALVACRIDDGLLAPLAVWERPDGHAGVGWEVSTAAVKLVVAAAFRRYRVARFEADPPRWHEQLEEWTAKWGEDVVRAFHTFRPTAMGPAIDRFEVGYRSGLLRHTGDATLQQHVCNVAEDMDRGWKRWAKAKPGAFIDAAVAAAIAYDARGRVRASGLTDDRVVPTLQRQGRAAYADAGR